MLSFKKLYGIVPSVPVFKVQYNTGLSRSRIRLGINILSRASTMPARLANYISRSSRVVFTRGRTLGSILYNYRSFAKRYDPDVPFTCVCKDFNFSTPGKHFCCKPNDFPDKEVRSIIDQNMKNVVYEENPFVWKSVFYSLFVFNSRIVSMGYTSFAWWILGPVANVISYTTSVVSVGIPWFLRLSYAKQFKTTYLSGPARLFCACLDRNLGACVFMCPQKFGNAFQKLYDWKSEKANYKQHEESTGAILKRWRTFYKDNGFEKIFKIRYGSLPWAYAFPKNKDDPNFDKMRPIVSYASHPFSTGFNQASRVLNFMLLRLPDASFNLAQTNQLVGRINATNDKFNAIRAEMSDETFNIVQLDYDVKEAYTSLPHKSIMRAVEFVVEKARNGSLDPDKRLTQRLAVQVKGPKGVRWGRSYNSYTHTEWDLDSILKIVRFDLDNAIFTLGDKIILRQTGGCPMGGPLSVPYLGAMCITAEIDWIKSLGVDAKYISPIRFFDDGKLIALIPSSHPPDFMEKIGSSYQEGCYDAALIVESVKDGHYLENIIDVDRSGQLFVSHYSKNLSALMENTAPKFKKIQDFRSRCPDSVHEARVYGLFHRVYSNISTTHPLGNILLIEGILGAILELQHANCHPLLITKCLYRANNKLTRTSGIYKLIAKFYKLTTKRSCASRAAQISKVYILDRLNETLFLKMASQPKTLEP